MIRSARRWLTGHHVTITNADYANGCSRQSACNLRGSWGVVGECRRGRPTRDNRTFDAGMAEACAEGDVRLLAYAPLAAGLLSGKYHAPSAPPQDARLERYAKTGGDEDMQRYHPEGINVGEVRALVSNPRPSRGVGGAWTPAPFGGWGGRRLHTAALNEGRRLR